MNAEVVTYSLRGGGGDSDQYYRDVEAFTDEVLAKGGDLYPIVESFQAYVREHGIEKVRSREEYLFELLMLGTLWRLYCDDAHDLPGMPRKVLIGLADLRKHGGSIKQAADVLRGVMATVFLSPVDRPWFPRPTPDHLGRLIDWMAATGDFQQEVKRLQAWQGFRSGSEPHSVCGDIQKAIDFAGWFDTASTLALGKYTLNVDRFLKEKQPGHRWKEDVVFSARRRIEYHLNMVGAEVMNRAFREDFLKANKKAVVLPACMRFHPKPICKARMDGLSCECVGCTPLCRVNQLTKMGKQFGFGVFLVPHESSVFTGNGGKKLVGDGVGIVGIACVSNLVSGGWKAKGLGLSPQCVLLDNCGCRKHWHERGIPTDINMARLRQTLGITEQVAVA
jgi:hypothetical protein